MVTTRISHPHSNKSHHHHPKKSDIDNLVAVLSNRQPNDFEENGAVQDLTITDLVNQHDGYQHDLKKNFSTLSLLGLGFGLTNAWFGISASLVSGISSGGPMLIVYGLLIVTVMAFAISISLSELVSAFPENSGGQYYWTFQLAPPKIRRFWAYICGVYSWFGAIFASSSITLSIASAIVGMYVLATGRDYAPKTWEVFVTFEIMNVFIALFNIYERPLPYVATSTLYISLVSFFTITITVLICARGNYQTAKFVFVDFNNATGWSSSGLAFIVGLINPTWAYGGLDAAVHMCEEMHEPERKIPLALMANVTICFVTAFSYCIAMFYSINDLDTILKGSLTGVPILDIFSQAVKNVGGAVFLEVLVVVTAIGCCISAHSWQARLCWSFARDEGLPGSRYWKQINKTTNLPVNAHIMSCFWCAILGCIYMGSSTAYNAIVTGSIQFCYGSYAIPIIFLLIKGRNNIVKGPFWLGWVGLVANWITILWVLFTFIFFCFPFTMPVTVQSMNYVAVVLVGLTGYAVIYWHARAKKVFAQGHIPRDDLIEEMISLSNEMSQVQCSDEEDKIGFVSLDTRVSQIDRISPIRSAIAAAAIAAEKSR